MRTEIDEDVEKVYLRPNERLAMEKAFEYMDKLLRVPYCKKLSKAAFVKVVKDCVLGDFVCPDTNTSWGYDDMSLEEYRLRKAVNGEDADYDSEERDVQLETLVGKLPEIAES